MRQAALNQFILARIELAESYFNAETAAVISRPLAKFASFLAANVLLGAEGAAAQYQPAFDLSVPPDRSDRLALFELVQDGYLDPGTDRTAERFQRGILMQSFIALYRDTKKSPVALTPAVDVPEGGHSTKTFTAAIDAQLEGENTFRDIFVTEITELADKDTAVGAGRVTQVIEGFTFSYPAALAEAVHAAAPEMRAYRESIDESASEDVFESLDLPEPLGEDLAGFGLGIETNIAEWFASLPENVQTLAPEMTAALLAIDAINL